MAGLKDLYTGTFVVLFLLVIYVFVYYYKKEEDSIEDTDNDGSISTSEIAYHVKKELNNKSRQPPRFWTIVKGCLTGLLRGFLMGILLNGVEGAVVTSISLGIINPIMIAIEHWF